MIEVYFVKSFCPGNIIKNNLRMEKKYSKNFHIYIHIFFLHRS